MTNQENKEFKINWTGVIKYTVIAGVIGAAYYVGKKQGAKQEALKHVSTTQPVVTTTVETPEI